jgi:hypothetical protein
LDSALRRRLMAICKAQTPPDTSASQVTCALAKRVH